MKMEENTRVLTTTIKSMVTASTLGPTGNHMMVSGKMVSSTATPYLQVLQVNQEKVTGKMVIE